MSNAETNTSTHEDCGVGQLVRDEDRHFSFFDIFTTWAGANCQPTSWWIGGCIAAGGLFTVLKVNLISVPLMFIIVALVGYIGFRYPTTTMGFSRTIFGIHGSRYLALFHSISCLGWTGVNCYLGACSLSYMFNYLLGWPAVGMPGSKWVLAVGIAICAGLTVALITIQGTRSLKVFENIGTVLIIILSIWIAYAVFKNYNMQEIIRWKPDPAYALSFGQASDAITAFAFGWVICVIEFTRYSKTKAAATGAPLLGCWFGLSLFAMVGTVGVIATTMMTGVFNEYSADPSGVAATLGLGWPAFLVILFSVVTTTVVGQYVGACSALNAINDRIPIKKMVWIYSLICFAFAFVPLLFDSFLSYFYAFMDVLGLLWPPIAAIFLVDFYLIRKGKYYPRELFNLQGPYFYRKGFNLYAWLSFAIGIAAYLVFKQMPGMVSAVGALYPGFFLTGAAYFIAARVAVKNGAYVDMVNPPTYQEVHCG